MNATQTETTEIRITTEKRSYTAWVLRGVWKVSYQPINPKTGYPWQAERYMTAGQNVWIGVNHKTETQSEIFPGKPPEFEIWSKEWTGLFTGFASKADALAAIEKDIAKTAK